MTTLTDEQIDDDTPAPEVTGSPERIYLNYGDIERDCTHAECSRDGEVTWCEDSAFSTDVAYVREAAVSAAPAHEHCKDTEWRLRAALGRIAQCQGLPTAHAIAGVALRGFDEPSPALREAPTESEFRPLENHADTRVTRRFAPTEPTLREAVTEPAGKTGYPPSLLQDDSKGLSKWLSNQPDARRRVREALHLTSTEPCLREAAQESVADLESIESAEWPQISWAITRLRAALAAAPGAPT